MPPLSVLCTGTHPIGGKLSTPILLAPTPYSSCTMSFSSAQNKQQLLLKSLSYHIISTKLPTAYNYYSISLSLTHCIRYVLPCISTNSPCTYWSLILCSIYLHPFIYVLSRYSNFTLFCTHECLVNITRYRIQVISYHFRAFFFFKKKK